MVGAKRPMLSGRKNTTPVPRGPNSHLWQPAASMSAPSWSKVTSSTPKPCTPSTQSSTFLCGSRPALTPRRAWAISGIGIFRPVELCTQVRARARVRSVIAPISRPTISPFVALAAWSNRLIFLTAAPLRRADSRRLSWVT